jgi:hypothetical protein
VNAWFSAVDRDLVLISLFCGLGVQFMVCKQNYLFRLQFWCGSILIWSGFRFVEASVRNCTKEMPHVQIFGNRKVVYVEWWYCPFPQARDHRWGSFLAGQNGRKKVNQLNHPEQTLVYSCFPLCVPGTRPHVN